MRASVEEKRPVFEHRRCGMEMLLFLQLTWNAICVWYRERVPPTSQSREHLPSTQLGVIGSMFRMANYGISCEAFGSVPVLKDRRVSILSRTSCMMHPAQDLCCVQLDRARKETHSLRAATLPGTCDARNASRACRYKEKIDHGHHISKCGMLNVQHQREDSKVQKEDENYTGLQGTRGQWFLSAKPKPVITASPLFNPRLSGTTLVCFTFTFCFLFELPRRRHRTRSKCCGAQDPP